MIIGKKQEFVELAEFVLKDFMSGDYEGHEPIDIVWFAEHYLGLPISFQTFTDRTVEGRYDGTGIQLDARFRYGNHVGERNFTIAHECAHHLLRCQESLPDLVAFRERAVRKKLSSDHDFLEWQANVIASALLMRRPLMDWCRFTFLGNKKVLIRDEEVLFSKDHAALTAMANYVGVSLSALMIWMKENGAIAEIAG